MNYKARFLVVMAIINLAGLCQPANAAAGEPAQPRVLHVVVHDRYFRVNPTAVPPGPVQIIIENRTALAAPTVTIYPQAADGKTVAKGQVANRSKSTNRWFDITLESGVYWVVLDQDSSSRAKLVVDASKGGAAK